jgi:shikimate kinase
MYEVRHPLYTEAADAIIEVSHQDPPQTAADELIKTFTELI